MSLKFLVLFGTVFLFSFSIHAQTTGTGAIERSYYAGAVSVDNYDGEDHLPKSPKEVALDAYTTAHNNWKKECVNIVGFQSDSAECRQLRMAKDLAAIQLAKITLAQEYAKEKSVGLERAAKSAQELEREIRSLYNAHANSEANLAMVNAVYHKSEFDDLNADVARMIGEVKATNPKLKVYDQSWTGILRDLEEIAMVPVQQQAGSVSIPSSAPKQ